MIPSFPNKLPPSPIYRKAQEIFTLSRHISSYITEDLAVLEEDGQEHPSIYFGGDIVQQSESLVPEIIKAESQTYSEEKHRYAASVTKLINRLHKNCERLEGANSNGKDFLPLLRGEIKKFRKLQRTWMLTL